MTVASGVVDSRASKLIGSPELIWSTSTVSEAVGSGGPIGLVHPDRSTLANIIIARL